MTTGRTFAPLLPAEIVGDQGTKRGKPSIHAGLRLAGCRGPIGDQQGTNRGLSYMMKIHSIIHALCPHLPRPALHLAGHVRTVSEIGAKGLSPGALHRAAQWPKF